MNRKIYTRSRVLKWANDCGIVNSDFVNAIEEMQQGLIDAELGGNLYKKRIPLSGRGKRGGARVIIATRFDDRWIIMEGFAKNERDNVTHKELLFLRNLAADYLAYTREQMDLAVKSGVLKEVNTDE